MPWGVLFRAVVFTLCAYEIVAIGTGRVPTITALSHQARNTVVGVVVIVACLLFLAWHLLIEGN